MVDFDGYYLESDPCLVCNNPEVPYTVNIIFKIFTLDLIEVCFYSVITFCDVYSLQNTKLSAIKVDSKFTTTTQIVKLMGSHNISKVSIRISDLKRTKMVREANNEVF